jgi:two-component system NtrC family sensor kinase
VPLKTNILNRLSVKLIISITVILIIFLATHTYITINNFDEALTEARFQSADNISELIKRSTRYGMMLNRREDVHEIINTIGGEAGVINVRIYNKQGEIIYSTDSSEIFYTVDMQAEACYGCHSEKTPLRKLSTDNRMRIFETPDHQRVLGLINPIENEPDCYNAGCHAHPPDIDILGVLDVRLSLSELDATVSEVTTNTLTYAVIITATIGLFAGLFITFLVNRPVKKLVKGIQEVGEGNLKYRIDIKSNDEIGEVGKRFNEMSAKLDSAYNEIKDWSENLNQKVKEKTEELKNIYNQVNQIEKLASLGKLSATVAHELNNPLEGILTYSKLVSKKLKSANNEEHTAVIKYLDLISEETARCGKIVKDLLLFSNVGEDQFSEEDIIPVIEKSINIISHHLEMNGITLIKDFEKEEFKVLCNPQKIQQVLVALLINAIEAMQRGGKITVKVNVENDKTVIRVKDEGSGISPKDLPNIFEPFYSTKESGQGTGLGLAVTYGIVKNHNGSIVVEETSSSGTTFKIELPLIK